MLRYEKLPKKTPFRIVLGILFIGMCLSYSIVVYGLLVFYCVIGLLSGYFYSGSNIVLSGKEAGYTGVLLLISVVTAVTLSFLAYYMNALSRLTYPLSRVLWIPTILTTGFVWWQHSSPIFNYHISTPALLVVVATIPLGAVFPALFLSSRSARRLHSR